MSSKRSASPSRAAATYFIGTFVIAFLVTTTAVILGAPAWVAGVAAFVALVALGFWLAFK